MLMQNQYCVPSCGLLPGESGLSLQASRPAIVPYLVQVMHEWLRHPIWASSRWRHFSRVSLAGVRVVRHVVEKGYQL